MMTTGPQVEGRVERRTVLDGSRSAREAFVLVTRGADGVEDVLRVHVVGDESFDESALAPFAGCQVSISGGRLRNRVLRVSMEMISLKAPEVAPSDGEGA